MKYIKSITGHSFISSFLISVTLLGLLGFLWFQAEESAMEEGYQTFKTDYIASQKTLIQNEVNKVIDFIAYSKSLTEERVRIEIKSRVDEAYDIAMHLYLTYRDTKSQTEIQNMVKEALRPLRFNRGRGYYFATRLDGTEMLFADRPQLEGKNLINMRDTQGKWVIKDMIAIAKGHGEGFYTYTWTKPGSEGKSFPKMAYIKYFGPFDWLIGTGEYIDEMESIIKEEVLDRIQEIHFGENGYIFAFQTDGLYLSHPTLELVGKNILKAEKSQGAEVHKRFVEIVQKDAQGFMEYTWAKPKSGRPEKKLTYVRLFEGWNWIIGTGIYLDELDAALLSAKKRQDQRLKAELYTIGTLLAGLLITLALITYFLSKRLSKGIRTFDQFFTRAATLHTKIDEDELHFTEFKALAARANLMVEEVANAKLELAELNQGLEEQVHERTAELEKANAELTQLDEAKSTFIATVSHELRTPLTSILGFTKLIDRDVKRYFCPLGACDDKLNTKATRIISNLGIMEIEGERLTRLISDILDLSRIESGRMDWRMENIHLKDCIGMVLNSLSGQLANKPDLTLEQEIAPNLPVIKCDIDRLAQVITNLAGNAMKFMEQGTIRIEAQHHGDNGVQVLVIDDGPGISPEDCKVIFDKFRQAQVGTKASKPDGSGLGLPISKQIIEHFGGKIWVESELGKGSCFGFSLPGNGSV